MSGRTWQRRSLLIYDDFGERKDPNLVMLLCTFICINYVEMTIKTYNWAIWVLATISPVKMSQVNVHLPVKDDMANVAFRFEDSKMQNLQAQFWIWNLMTGMMTHAHLLHNARRYLRAIWKLGFPKSTGRLCVLEPPKNFKSEKHEEKSTRGLHKGMYLRPPVFYSIPGGPVLHWLLCRYWWMCYRRQEPRLHELRSTLLSCYQLLWEALSSHAYSSWWSDHCPIAAAKSVNKVCSLTMYLSQVLWLSILSFAIRIPLISLLWKEHFAISNKWWTHILK